MRYYTGMAARQVPMPDQPIALPPASRPAVQRVQCYNAFCPVVWGTDIIGSRLRESASES
jgi:hypothetical protein